jgi:nickel-dependent lactate racemase
MKVKLPYGRDTVPVVFPDNTDVQLIYPNEVPVGDEDEIIGGALDSPVSGPPIQDFFSGREEVWFILNDATRPTPTPRMLKAVLDRLPEIDRDKIRFMVATGSHRAPTDGEWSAIIGDRSRLARTVVHDARDEDQLAVLGRSPQGHQIILNKEIVKADKLVLLNSVEPHYFAGYTGGRKSIFPGVAAYDTIERNHRLALEPGAGSLKLSGNPVHEDMMAGMSLLNDKKIYSLQTVLNRRHRVVSAYAGDLDQSFGQAVDTADDVFSVTVEEEADIVVVVVLPPKDINLYQAQNAVENGRRVLKKGGIMILVTPCREGIGPDNFFHLLCDSENVTNVLERARMGYRLGYHKAVKFAETVQGGEIWTVTSLPDHQVRGIFLRPFASIQNAVDLAYQTKGAGARTVVLLDGDKTVPTVTR